MFEFKILIENLEITENTDTGKKNINIHKKKRNATEKQKTEPANILASLIEFFIFILINRGEKTLLTTITKIPVQEVVKEVPK